MLKLAEPDFTLVGLPTSLRLPKFKSAFRVTHRFTRPLGQGDFGDLAGDLFGIDSGRPIGLEYRFGIVRNGQIGIHRTSDKTIEFFGSTVVMRQGASSPFDVSAVVTIDGTNNFKDSYSPRVGAIVSRRFGDIARRVRRTDLGQQHEPAARRSSSTTTTRSWSVWGRASGFGRRSTSSANSRPGPGYDPGVNHGSFAIEKRAGGHTFQLNFSNSFGTTMGQIARGGPDGDDGTWASTFRGSSTRMTGWGGGSSRRQQ